MKNIIKIYLYLLVAGIFMNSCADFEPNRPLEHNSNPPGEVTNIEVFNMPGKSLITYSLPKDQDLLYVKATYTLPATGEKTEVISSYYNKGLIVDGFALEDEYEVTLVAVNRSEVESNPVKVMIKPQASPIYDILKSIEVKNTFGGYNVEADNPEGVNIVIEILSLNDFGEWEMSDNSIYTSQQNILRKIRGLDTINYEYRLTVRDHWLNYTDTITAKVKPLFETLIKKSNYSAVSLSDDAPPNPRCKGIHGMWDEDIMHWPNVLQTQTDYTPTTPHVITFSVGKKVFISRIKIWDYPEYDQTGRPYYVAGALKEFEIWGCPTQENVPLPEVGVTDPTNPWVLLGTFESVKPSGLPYGQMNDEDRELAQAGFDWDCNTDVPEVQFIRIRCLKNYLGTTFMAIAELQVYGGESN